MTVTYLVGDVREVMVTIADGSVDLIATSPPFLALRSYLPADHDQKHAEIGSDANPAAYIDMLLNLTAEWGRVLAPHGSIAVELGDTFAASPNQRKPDNDGALDKSRWLRGDRDNGVARPASGSGPGWPRPKSLALIPQLYAVALAYGINPLTGNPSPAGRWLVRNVIVWHRPNPAVGALGDKVRPSTSYIVIATRSPKRWFDLTAVRHDHKEAPPTEATAISRKRALNRDAPGNHTENATIGIQANPAGAPPLDAWFDQYDSEITTEVVRNGQAAEQSERTNPLGVRERFDPRPISDPYDGTHDTWTLTTQPSGLAHYAMWPAKLAERLILMMCPLAVCRECGEPRRRVEASERLLDGNVTTLPTLSRRADDSSDGVDHNRISYSRETLGWTSCGHDDFRPGLVLDPFAGSGTTLAVADLHGRDAIGIDVDERNEAIYPRRFDEVKRALYGTPAPQPGQGVLAL